MGKAARLRAVKKAAELRLDLGCGKSPAEGFTGVDIMDFGQSVRADLCVRWPWKDGTVTEARASHFVEHLTAPSRIHFVNELYRVLIPGGKCLVVTPHWASTRAYGDLTHQWPPVAEFWWYYLSKDWRKENAPHNDAYTCDFEATWGYTLNPALHSRNQEYQSFALQNYKEAASDMVCTLTKR
jgi:SAM-dependent methyltransferase